MVEYENTNIINLMDSTELVSLNEGSLLLATDVEEDLYPITTKSNDDDMQIVPSPKSKTNKLLKIIIAILVLTCIILSITLAVIVKEHKHSELFRKKKRTAVDENDLIYFFQLSDVHLDIYYSATISNEKGQMCRNSKENEMPSVTKDHAKYGRVKCDSPEALLKSAATYMKDINGNLVKPIDFILVSGDQSAHKYEKFPKIDHEKATLDSINASMRILAEQFPDVPIIPAIGNNDLFIDYVPPIENSSQLYIPLKQIFEPYLFPNLHNTSMVVNEFRATFGVGGYYKFTLQDKHLVILVLNTNYWSNKAYDFTSKITLIGDKQMSWLNKELEMAKNQSYKVIIVGHIPPGCDSYNSERNWLQNYTRNYTTLVSTKYKELIAAQLYGHHHRDKIRMLYTEEYLSTDNHTNKTALLMSPSITPIYENSPAFRLFAYNQREGNLYNYTQYYMDLALSNVFNMSSWKKEYSFLELYNSTVTTLNLENLVDQIPERLSPVWIQYRDHMTGLYGSVPLSQRFKEYCVAKHVSMDEYTNCLSHFSNYGKV